MLLTLTTTQNKGDKQMANKIKAKGEAKAPEETISTSTSLPKGISQEMYDTVKATILSGFAANQTPDAIKSAIFASGVPFSKLTKLYSMITQAEGLVVDPKLVNTGLATEMKKVKINYEASYEELSAVADTVAAAVKGATAAKVLSMIKASFKENEVEFPRRPAPSRGRMGVINKTLIDVFKENPKATELELEQALAKITKTPKNANDYAKQYHKTCYALANGLSANQVLTVFSADND